MLNEAKGVVSTVTGVTAASISLASISTVVSIIAGVLASIASGFAIYFYVKRIRRGD